MKNYAFPISGIILVGLGSILLLDKLDVIDVRFNQVLWGALMAWGFAGVVQGFSGAPGKIFWSTLVFLNAMFFFLRSLDSFDMPSHMLIPSILLSLGIAFLMLFLNNTREWVFLLPSFFLTGAGVVVIMAEQGYIYPYDVWDLFRTYWPVALIIVGLSIILRRRIQLSQQKSATQTENSLQA